MRNRRNYYRLLHVEPDAPTAVIEASYRTLMRRLGLHPDLGGDHAEAVMINEAWDTLRDPGRRAAYDQNMRRLHPAQERGRHAALASAPVETRGELAGTVTRPVLRLPARFAPTCAFCHAPATALGASTPDSVCESCGCALSPAPLHPGDGTTRRAIGRVRRHMSISFRMARAPHSRCQGTTENINVKGMQFRTEVAIPIGERLQIDCDFCSAVAIVRGIYPGAGATRGFTHYGVEFLTLLLRRDRGALVSTVA